MHAKHLKHVPSTSPPPSTRILQGIAEGPNEVYNLYYAFNVVDKILQKIITHVM